MKDTNEYNPLLETIARLPVLPPRNAIITPQDVNIIPLRDNEGRWLQGQSAHPEGRPPVKHCISDQLRRILDLSPEEIKDFKPTTGAQVIALRMYKDSDSQVLKELLNRAEGKVTDVVDMRTQAVSILYEMVKPKEDKEA